MGTADTVTLKVDAQVADEESSDAVEEAIAVSLGVTIDDISVSCDADGTCTYSVTIEAGEVSEADLVDVVEEVDGADYVGMDTDDSVLVFDDDDFSSSSIYSWSTTWWSSDSEEAEGEELDSY